MLPDNSTKIVVWFPSSAWECAFFVQIHASWLKARSLYSLVGLSVVECYEEITFPTRMPSNGTNSFQGGFSYFYIRVKSQWE